MLASSAQTSSEQTSYLQKGQTTNPIIDLATQRQQTAANPYANAWVDASAGSGKTKVLTDRVLSLLLTGVKPEEILCLTYTKAAANEMAGRVRKTLAKWAAMETGELQQALAALNVSQDTNLARSLFNQMLDSSLGLQAQTIHGFCERVLRQFPLEAELPVGFQVLVEGDAKALFKTAFENLATLPDARESLLHLAQYATDGYLEDITRGLVENRRQLRACFMAHPQDGDLKTQLYTALNITDDDLSEDALTQRTIPLTECRELYKAFKNSPTKSDHTTAEKLAAWGQQGCYNSYESIFLTATGQPRKKLFYAKTPLTEVQKELLLAEAQQVASLKAQLNAREVFDKSTALLDLALNAWQQYEQLKQKKNVVDYEDLIDRTVALLGVETAAWVRFKLDQRIKHILVDEAQDSSDRHWQLIDALTAEFSQHNEHRSLFVVGDYKQSIYSFQGAAPNLFQAQRSTYSHLPNWQEVGMNVSFRSSPAILNFADKIHNQTAAKSGVAINTLTHQAAFEHKGGQVELWPLIEYQKPAVEPWTLPFERTEPENATDSLCVQIVEKISNWLENNETIDGHPNGKPIAAGDILILLQSRRNVAVKLRQSLAAAGIPVMDSDRLTLNEELLVKDLMALANVMLCPQDDYSLACVLKSPVFGFNEEELFNACHNRENTLWQNLDPDINKTLNTWRKTAQYKTPHTFFTQVLYSDNIQQNFNTCMGAASLDLIKLFIEKVLEFESTNLPTLQGFILWMQQQNHNVKSELTKSDKVRVMTVHGSKGLESPVVILADTTRTPTNERAPYFCDDQKLFYYGNRQQAEAVDKTASALTEKQQQEYHRLLYVAMTRAEHRLCFAGIETAKSTENSWYDYAQRVLGDQSIYSYPASQPTIAEIKQLESKEIVLPNWLTQNPVHEPVITAQPVTESSNDNTPQNTIASNIGIEIHCLLQHLPQLPEEQWPNYTDNTRALTVAKNVIKHPDFQWIFTTQSRAELPVSGFNQKGVWVEGRIDRVVIDSGTVHIIDYKTGTPENNAPKKIVHQLETYKYLLSKIYPNHIVKSYILWTQNITLVEI